MRYGVGLKMSSNQVIYDLQDNIPFFTNLEDKNGVALTGKDVRIKVVDLSNLTTVLADQSMSEVTADPGNYFFLWNPNFTTKKNLLCRMYIMDTKPITIDVFVIRLINDLQFYADKIDENDGQAI